MCMRRIEDGDGRIWDVVDEGPVSPLPVTSRVLCFVGRGGEEIRKEGRKLLREFRDEELASMLKEDWP